MIFQSALAHFLNKKFFQQDVVCCSDLRLCMKKKACPRVPLLQIASAVSLLCGIPCGVYGQTHPPVNAVWGATINLTGGDPVPYANSGAFGFAIGASGVGSTVNVIGTGGIKAQSTNLVQTGVVYAGGGGRINLGTGSFIYGEGYNPPVTWAGAVGITASNPGSYITARDITIDVSSDYPYGVYAIDGGQIDLFGHTKLDVYNGVNTNKSSYGLASLRGGILNAEDVNLTMDGKSNLYSLGAYGVFSSTNASSALVNTVSISGDLTLRITSQNLSAVFANGANNAGVASQATLKSLSGTFLAKAANGEVYILYANNSGVIDVSDTVNVTATSGGWNVGALAQNKGKITLSGAGLSTWDLTSNNGTAAGIFTAGAGTSVTMDGQSIWKVAALGSTGAVYGIRVGAGSEVTTTGHSKWTLTQVNDRAIGLHALSGGIIKQTGDMELTVNADVAYGIASIGGGSTISAENVDLAVTGTTFSSAIYSTYGTASLPDYIELSNSVLHSNKQGIVVEDGYLNVDFKRTILTNDAGNAFNVSATSVGSTALVVNADASKFTGSAITDKLSQFDLSLSNGSQWAITSSSNLTNLVNDQSTIAFSAPLAGKYKTLSISGNYAGHSGNVILNTQLGGDESLTDLIHVGGDATGTTWVTINNIGGLGAQTYDGIMLVQVDGLSDANAFALAAPVSAGAYEYILKKGNDVNTQNWYLSNTLIDKPIYSTSVGGYLGNQYVAGTMFNQNILDRRYSIRDAGHNLWLRTNYGDSRVYLLGGTQDAEFTTNLIQAGVDLYQKNDIVAGLYAGYGNSHVRNESRQTTSKARGTVDGYQVGAYVSWLPEENQGPFIDFWGYYGWYHNEIRSETQINSTKYNSTGYALSVEAGYGIDLGQAESRNWVFEPHAQLIYSRVGTNSFLDSRFTRYGKTKIGGWQSRLGARLYGKTSDYVKSVTPFVELNWLHSTLNGKSNLNYIPADSSIAKNVGEVKLGVQGYITEHLSLWGHMGLQSGSDHYRRHELQLGIGYRW